MTVDDLGEIVARMQAQGQGSALVLMDQPLFPGLLTIQRHGVVTDVRFEGDDGRPTGDRHTALVLSIREEK